MFTYEPLDEILDREPRDRQRERNSDDECDEIVDRMNCEQAELIVAADAKGWGK